MDNFSKILSNLSAGDGNGLQQILESVGKILRESQSDGASSDNSSAVASEQASMPAQKQPSESVSDAQTALQSVFGSSADSRDHAGPDVSDASSLLLSLMQGLQSEFGKNSDQNSHCMDLLMALKPYVRSARAERIDRAADMLRMAYLARSALGAFRGR